VRLIETWMTFIIALDSLRRSRACQSSQVEVPRQPLPVALFSNATALDFTERDTVSTFMLYFRSPFHRANGLLAPAMPGSRFGVGLFFSLQLPVIVKGFIDDFDRRVLRKYVHGAIWRTDTNRVRVWGHLRLASF
jgi:hypothetical protein